MLTVFYLPDAFGGLLDLVRDIVADSITQNLAAGREVKNATLFLERGDAAKAESHFREAYDLYQTAVPAVDWSTAGETEAVNTAS